MYLYIKTITYFYIMKFHHAFNVMYEMGKGKGMELFVSAILSFFVVGLS